MSSLEVGSRTQITQTERISALAKVNCPVQSLPIIPRGMINKDNTCYAISCVQFLFHMTPFRDIICLSPVNNTRGVHAALQTTFTHLLKPNMTPLDPVEIRNLCRELKLTLKVHHDAGEFMALLVVRLSAEIPTFDSSVVEVYRSIVCYQCTIAHDELTHCWWLQQRDNDEGTASLNEGMQRKIHRAFATDIEEWVCCRGATVECCFYQFSGFRLLFRCPFVWTRQCNMGH